jgi:hypothetical protein
LRAEFRRADQGHGAGLQQRGGGVLGLGAAADHQDGTATQVGKKREHRGHGQRIERGGPDRNAGI